MCAKQKQKNILYIYLWFFNVNDILLTTKILTDLTLICGIVLEMWEFFFCGWSNWMANQTCIIGVDISRSYICRLDKRCSDFCWFIKQEMELPMMSEENSWAEDHIIKKWVKWRFWTICIWQVTYQISKRYNPNK